MKKKKIYLAIFHHLFQFFLFSLVEQTDCYRYQSSSWLIHQQISPRVSFLTLNCYSVGTTSQPSFHICDILESLWIYSFTWMNLSFVICFGVIYWTNVRSCASYLKESHYKSLCNLTALFNCSSKFAFSGAFICTQALK